MQDCQIKTSGCSKGFQRKAIRLITSAMKIFLVFKIMVYKSFNFLEFTISISCNAELWNRPVVQEETLSVNSTVAIYCSVKSILWFLLLLVSSSFRGTRSSQRKRKYDLNRFSIADARYILVKIESRNFGDLAKSARYRYQFFVKIMCISFSRGK